MKQIQNTAVIHVYDEIRLGTPGFDENCISFSTDGHLDDEIYWARHVPRCELHQPNSRWRNDDEIHLRTRRDRTI